MDLSIIILNYKQRGLVKQCIRGIFQSDVKLSYEIIVVDNNSGDGCLEMIKEDFPGAISIQASKNGGFAFGNNLGIRKARGKYIMVLNPDIAIVSGVIEKMYNFMEENHKAGIAGPKLINPDGTFQYSCRRYPSWQIPIYRRTFLGNLKFARKKIDQFLMKDKDYRKNLKVDWLFGACLFIRKSSLDKVGLFDERFFMYFEDLDLCRRFWENGFEVWYLANVEVVHYHQRISANSSVIFAIFNKATRIHVLSGIKYFAKYLGVKNPESITLQNKDNELK